MKTTINKSFKKCLFTILLLILSNCVAFSQNIGINGTGSLPNNSALLDIDATGLATKKGILIPRVTLVEKTAMNPLPTAAQGLMVYQTNGTEGFYYNTSTTITPLWVYISPSGTGWSTTGNTATVDGSNYIGTNDNIPFNIRVNNQKAGRIDNTQQNTFFGYVSGNANTTGVINTAFGDSTLYSNTTGFYNTASGGYALYNNNGNHNTANGIAALYSNTVGNENTANGSGALAANTTGVGNVAHGFRAGVTANPFNSNVTGSYNVFIGYDSGPGFGSLQNAIAIGKNALVNTSNSMVLGGTGADAVNVGIGIAAPDPSALLDLTSATKGLLTPRVALTATTSALPITTPATSLLVYNTATVTDVTPGYYYWNGTAWIRFVTVGSSTGTDWSLLGNAGTFDGTNFIGTTDNIPFNIRVNNQTAGKIDNTLQNTFYGYVSGNDNTTGNNNTAIGDTALYANSIGNYNTATGGSALRKNTTGVGNVAHGFQAGLTANSFNANTTGSYNVFLGYNSGPGVTSASNLQNAIAIGKNALVNTSNSMVLGGTGTSAVNVGIGTSTPVARLHVVGNIRASSLAGVGTRVVQADINGTLLPLAAGIATEVLLGTGVWGAVPTNTAWGLLGNTATVDGTNFIGTTDNIPLNFRVNNQKAGRIDNTLRNTFYGYVAGNTNTTGNNNTAVGDSTLYANTTGFGNTATGKSALRKNAGGFYNTANGMSALYSNTNGYNNTANGYQSLYSNTTGLNNTANGYLSLYSNTSGEYNVVTGGYALANNTTGSNNTANGMSTLYSNTTGFSNTAIGGYAHNRNTTASQNTAIGYNSLFTQSFSNGGVPWSSYNTAVGNEALYSNQPTATTNGINNTALGHRALYSNTTGANNTANGYNALYSNQLGNDNTSLGRNSGLVSSGSNNIFVGSNAGNNLSSGNKNIIIGTDIDAPTPTGSNQLNIGNIIYGTSIDGTATTLSTGNIGIGTTAPTEKFVVRTATSSQGITHTDGTIRLSTYVGGAINGGYLGTISNHPLGFYVNNGTASMLVSTIGNVGIGTITPTQRLHVIGNGLFTGTVTASCGTLVCSDIRYKKDVKQLSNSLEKIMLLNGYTYHFKTHEFPEMNFNDKEQIGFIAQELEKLFPQMVFTDENGYKTVDYTKITPVLVEGMKEQQKQIEELKKQNELFLKRLEMLEKTANK